MTGTIANRSVPAVSVIPVLVYADVVEATDWLCKAFVSQSIADVDPADWCGDLVTPEPWTITR